MGQAGLREKTVNPDLSSAIITFLAASSPPELGAALIISHLGEG